MNTKKRHKKQRKTRHRKRRTKKALRGGMAVGSGGFGCVFRPMLTNFNLRSIVFTTESMNTNFSLKKDNDKRIHMNVKYYERKNNYISKMLLKEEASKEFEEIAAVRSIIEIVDNYSDYFVVDNIFIGDLLPYEPNYQDQEINMDINTVHEGAFANINKKCKKIFNRILGREEHENLRFDHINELINEGLISVITIPYGGKDLLTFMDEHNNTDFRIFLQINDLLGNLLNNAIIPMNQAGAYHCDLKLENVLINDTTTKIRIIDWGLCVLYNYVNIPPLVTQTESVQQDMYFNKIFNDEETSKFSKYLYRPLQFNLPFSCFIINESFYIKYIAFLKDNNINNNNSTDLDNAIKNFLYNYLYSNYTDRNNIYGLNKICMSYLKIKQVEIPGFINYYNSKIIKNIKSNFFTSFFSKNKPIYPFTIDNICWIFIIEYNFQILKKFTKNSSDGKIYVDYRTYIENVYLKNVDIWGFVIMYMDVLNEFNYTDPIEILFECITDNPTKPIDIDIINSVIYRT
jgi:serine/threonine protein kinase